MRNSNLVFFFVDVFFVVFFFVVFVGFFSLFFSVVFDTSYAVLRTRLALGPIIAEFSLRLEVVSTAAVAVPDMFIGAILSFRRERAWFSAGKMRLSSLVITGAHANTLAFYFEFAHLKVLVFFGCFFLGMIFLFNLKVLVFFGCFFLGVIFLFLAWLNYLCMKKIDGWSRWCFVDSTATLAACMAVRLLPFTDNRTTIAGSETFLFKNPTFLMVSPSKSRAQPAGSM